MENSGESFPKIDLIAKNSPETRFKKLAENTKGTITYIEDPNVKESIPYIINYNIDEPSPVGTIRIYRGVRNIPLSEATQLPSVLKTGNIDQELIDLTIELANNPSPEVYNKLKVKNDQLGNNNNFIDKAEKFIAETMEENGGDYRDAFKSMHRWENTASPYVSATDSFDSAFSYSMMNDKPGMVIVADIPESLITYDFSEGFDKEISIKGPIEQKNIKSILMVNKRHSIEDKTFIESAQKLIN